MDTYGDQMTWRRAAAAVCFIAIVLLAPHGAGQLARSAEQRQHVVDERTHVFHPVVSPDALALNASGQVIRSSGAMSASAAQQINALVADKAARTPAQRKISSKLIYTARMLQGLPAAPGVASLETGVER